MNARDIQNNTALHLAAWKDSLRVATFLVDEGADVSVKGEDGKTPLHLSAEFDSVKVAKLLLNKSRDELNARDNNNDTALHLAAWKDSLRVATLLVGEGANVSLKDKHGYTPLHATAYYDSIKVAKLLLNKSCDEMKARDNSNNTPLMVAESQNSEEALQLFQTVCVVN